MYAISSVNISKYKSLSEGMKSAFNKKDEARALKSTKSMKDGPQTTPFQGPFHDGLDELNQALIELQDGNYKINRQEGWVELDIKSGALFDSGDADLKPEAFVKLMQLAAKLKKSSSIVAVEGYTDNVPIETPQFPSNWELSAMRAAVVGRTLNSFGIATDRIFVTGYGEQYPVADNVTELGRAANRRVTIIIALNRNVPRLLNPAISEQDHSVIIGGKNKNDNFSFKRQCGYFLFIVNYLLNQRKKLISFREELNTQQKLIDQITKDHPVLIHADLLFSKQLKEINNQLISMDNQIQDLENKRDNDGGYRHALRILEMGGNRDEIVESCHLSLAEADLLMNLQAYRTAMKTS